MRLQTLVTALRRTAKSVHVVAVQRLGWPTRVLPIDVVIELVTVDEAWRGQGPRRKLDAVVYDPPPKPDPQWIKCYRNTHSVCLWTEGHYEPHQA